MSSPGKYLKINLIGPGAYSNNPGMNITKLRSIQHASHSKTANQKRRKMMQSSLDKENQNNTYDDTMGNLAPHSYSRKRVRAKPKGKIYKSSFNLRAHTSAENNYRKLNLKKPKSMISIQKNNETMKFSMTNPQLRNPSIPCKPKFTETHLCR